MATQIAPNPGGRAQPRRRRSFWALIVVLLGLLGVLGWKLFVGGFGGINLDTGVAGATTLTLPPGFTATIFASGLNNPRLMTVGPDGTLYVTERGNNRVVALPDRDGDGRADSTDEVVGNLHAPQSLSFHGADLLIGETDRISQVTLDANHHASAQRVLIPDLPADGIHTTKTVLVGPDGRVYVAMGSTCNACAEGDARRAAISVYNADGSGGRIFTKGLRNAVGLALNPVTGAIWASNNGRDLLGDDTPPETVNILRDGADFGWPRCHAGHVVDPDMKVPDACAGVDQPAAQMAAHMAPLGLVFYQGSAFPAPYRDSLYVAFHGSWNSTRLVGYKVMRVPLANGAVAGPAEDFATGWVQNQAGASGRPAGIAVAADGSLLVSDDKGGFIYRIRYGK